ncbi:MAG: GNAT family N-acetyltransferase [Opitutus sp.]|nr:GNAT family N-acetyltransferase [Opitutus sp.]
MDTSKDLFSAGGAGSPGRPRLGNESVSGALDSGVRPARSASPTWVIEAARPDDAMAIAALLQAAELPHEDFAAHLGRFLVARDARGRVVGVVGAEIHAAEALLRSLVVAPGHRGAGLGDELVRRLDAAGAGWGVTRWWLLTTTAEKFFAARGFAVSPREVAPPEIRATLQFRGGCSRSAVCLTRAQGAAR